MTRERILKAVRAAMGGMEAPIPSDYRRVGTLTPEERIGQFISRLEDYNAGVYRSTQIPEAIAKAMDERGKRSLLIPPGFPPEWLPGNKQFIVDDNLDYETLDEAEGALTLCTAAISFTGTIILTHSSAEGRRALTLIPDYHLCIVQQHQLHETVPEGFHALQARQRNPITTISGPSATSDIEMTRIKGVHGPRTLDVILA